ncbi:hypothetical protein FE243_08000 [Aliarcobacter thereius]|uniref:hypothetical protein n=1 Tax=Aliarcobacter thereius TaxID=544718 RepID=UPI0010FD405C|nr:hypothetical protein [Aliarcobacter thereius]TLT06520.1 hypothetical protein FE243_08000 [Aliarcobacter thereius]
MKEKILKIVFVLGLFYCSNVLAMTQEEYQELVSSYKLVEKGNDKKYIVLNSIPLTWKEYDILLKSNNLNDSATSSGFIKIFKINEEITMLGIIPFSKLNKILVRISYPKGSSLISDEPFNIDIYDQKLYSVACLSKNKEIVISSILISSSKDKKILFRELDLIKAEYYELYGYVANFFDLALVKDNLFLNIDKPYEENRDFPYFNEEKILNKLYEDNHCDKEETKKANIKIFLANGKWVTQEESWSIISLEDKE